MKVVLFCGGLGLRMGPTARRVPKPMMPIGGRPILWHIMSYYASYGVRDFILCVGHRAEVISRHFRRCEEVRTKQWSVEFLDTGVHESVGKRLRQVEPHLGDDEIFLANYGDVLTDAPLDRMVEVLVDSGKTALLLGARPLYNFHVIDIGADDAIRGISDVTTTGIRINGGFFVFRRDILSAIHEGEDLVDEPFRRLIEAGQLIAYPYDGFWAPMDTLKDQQLLESLHRSGKAPWLRRQQSAAAKTRQLVS